MRAQTHPQALARAHGGQLTQAQATQLLESDDLQHGGRPMEAASALWAEVGLQVHMLPEVSITRIMIYIL